MKTIEQLFKTSDENLQKINHSLEKADELVLEMEAILKKYDQLLRDFKK